VRLTWLIERAARLAGHEPALTGVGATGGATTLTWAQALERCRRMAGVFAELGAAPGARIAYLAHNSIDYFLAFYAAVWRGHVLVPLNTRHAVPELADIVDDCAADILITGETFRETGTALAARCESVRHLIVEGDDVPANAPEGALNLERLIADAEACSPVDGSGDETACLFYTSGTTGRPKGVMLTHANYYVNALGVLAAYRSGGLSPGLYPGPYFHVATAQRIFASVMAISHSIVLPRFEAGAVLDAIERHRVQILSLVPTMVGMLLDHERINDTDLSSLKTIGYGASPITEKLLRRMIERLPHVDLRQGYGMTEGAPLITILGAEEHRNTDTAPHLLRSAGKPLAHVDIAIVDADDNACETGAVGEIVVRGPNIMKGYWNRPGETAKALRHGWYHTGDAGYIDADGYLFIVDRVKDMIVSGGENVYSVEVENVLDQHPDVAQCAVIGIPDPRWVEAVHAVVVPREGAYPREDDLIAFCKERIANYKCPRSVTFRLTPLPLSGANKVLKTELRAEIVSTRSESGETAT